MDEWMYFGWMRMDIWVDGRLAVWMAVWTEWWVDQSSQTYNNTGIFIPFANYIYVYNCVLSRVESQIVQRFKFCLISWSSNANFANGSSRCPLTTLYVPILPHCVQRSTVKEAPNDVVVDFKGFMSTSWSHFCPLMRDSPNKGGSSFLWSLLLTLTLNFR